MQISEPQRDVGVQSNQSALLQSRVHIMLRVTNGDAKNFNFGAIAQGIWGRKSLSGVTQVRGLGSKYPRSSLQTLFRDFDCRNDQNLKTSHNSPPDS